MSKQKLSINCIKNKLDLIIQLSNKSIPTYLTSSVRSTPLTEKKAISLDK